MVAALTLTEIIVSYDSAGRVKRRLGASGVNFDNFYNPQGYLKQIKRGNGELYWEANSADAHGNVTQFTLGNGLVTTRIYDEAMGHVKSIQTGLNGAIQSLDYQFDTLGNLIELADNNQSLTETFTYDGLNRLETAQLNNNPAKTYVYDSIGNILNKPEMGSADYLYGQNGAGPHAVTQAGGNSYSYDANGNLESGGGRTIAWTSFNKPAEIVKDADNKSTFTYDADHNRMRQVKRWQVDGETRQTTTYYLGKRHERIVTHTGVTELKDYLEAPGVTIIATWRNYNGAHDIRYLHPDHLGSTDVVSKEDGGEVPGSRQSFNAWGERRSGNNWLDPLPGSYVRDFVTNVSSRGFTGHEQLDNVGLVHMNGRIYDAELGRFLSADPTVPEPANGQAFNRYSYVNNNPLSFTDPTGYWSDPFSGFVYADTSYNPSWGGAAGALPGEGALLPVRPPR